MVVDVLERGIGCSKHLSKVVCCALAALVRLAPTPASCHRKMENEKQQRQSTQRSLVSTLWLCRTLALGRLCSPLLWHTLPRHVLVL